MILVLAPAPQYVSTIHCRKIVGGHAVIEGDGAVSVAPVLPDQTPSMVEQGIAKVMARSIEQETPP